jgi:outer membrane protein OmpA-like peptidoglycan-associated protein
MNTNLRPRTLTRRTPLVLAMLAALSLAGCASAPQSPSGASEVRSKLSALQADTRLAGRAPTAQSEAEQAVALAEQRLPRNDAIGVQRVYLADRKVDIAVARATTAFTEAQREELSARQAQAVLEARTREAGAAQRDADRSRDQAYSARDEAERARQQLGSARDDADRAQRDAAAAADQSRRDAAAAAEQSRRDAAARDASALETDRLRRQITELEAERTERGLVLTLGDVLFATGSAELRQGTVANLDRLVAFLTEYPTRNVEIEGHTDAVGDSSYNQGLSERRAASVKMHLVQQGIGSERIATSGKGLSNPRVPNTADGSQPLNRRVEVIILEPGVALPNTQQRNS